METIRSAIETPLFWLAAIATVVAAVVAVGRWVRQPRRWEDLKVTVASHLSDAQQNWWLYHWFGAGLTTGAVAVIVKPDTRGADRVPEVLLGFHTYKNHRKGLWGLLGGALKKEYRELAGPSAGVEREFFEETGARINVVKLLGIDSDWKERKLDFFYECTIGSDSLNMSPTVSREVNKLAWYPLTSLPADMEQRHKRYLNNVLPRLSRLPGTTWTADQSADPSWKRLERADDALWTLHNHKRPWAQFACLLAYELRLLLNCEIVSMFVLDAPLKVLRPGDALEGAEASGLELCVQSHVRTGTMAVPCPRLPLQATPGAKLGLTAWSAQARPLGRSVLLHGVWLRSHPQVKDPDHHPYIDGRMCNSFAAVAVVGGGWLLGLLKAENKYTKWPAEPADFVPFLPDDGYILEEFARIAAIARLCEVKCTRQVVPSLSA